MRRYRIVALAVLVLVVALSNAACWRDSSSSASVNCGGDTASYQGKCLPRVMVQYLQCIEKLSFNSSSQVGASVTLPELANATLGLAYTKSKQVSDAAALETVRDCLTLAEEHASSGADQEAARKYAAQAAQDTTVIKNKLPKIELDPSGTLDCGSADIGGNPARCQVTIKSTGVAALRVSQVEVIGSDSGDFTAGSECADRPLAPGTDCVMSIGFQPAADGARGATLVIHQNLPAPDHGTILQLIGTGTGTVQTTRTLTLIVNGSIGTITSDPTGIACPDMCSAAFADGAHVTLTVTGGPTDAILIWEGACVTATNDSCAVDLAADSTVTVQDQPILH